MIGVIPHSPCQNRQIPAQPAAVVAADLAWPAQSVSLGVTGEPVQFRAPDDDLFRTPSLCGQACLFNAVLPVFFLIIRQVQTRQGSAAWREIETRTLKSGAFQIQVHPKPTTKKEGWAGCKENGFLRPWPFVRALRPAATRSPNRRCSVPAAVWSVRRLSTATRSSALPSVRRPISPIASNTPANADARQFGAAHLKNNLRSPADRTRHSHRAAPDRQVRRGALHLQIPKTKDETCSIKF